MKTKYFTLILALVFIIFAIGCPPNNPVVTRVIDGDTVEVSMGGSLYRVRYIGMDTPELDDERPRFRSLAQEAAELNRQLVEGEALRLEQDVSNTDRYGRLLRYVYVDGIFVNAELVRQGLAWAKAYPPDVKYQDILEEAEAEAREEEIGVWQEAQQIAK